MKIISKQTNSRSCIICGMDNELGVKAQFYNAEDDSVLSKFQFREVHQSYPGRVHGGLICAMLDELIGRALWIKEMGSYAVTTEISVKYRKPVPYNVPLIGRGYITRDSSRIYKGVGQIMDEQGNILAESEATYLKLPPQTISEGVSVDHEMCYNIPDDVTDIPVPPRKN